MSVLLAAKALFRGSRELGKWVCYFVAVTELIIEGSRLYGFSETVLSPIKNLSAEKQRTWSLAAVSMGIPHR